MKAIAAGTGMIDLLHGATPRVIAAAVLETKPGGGIALIDPGPGSTLPNLEGALRAAHRTLADVEAILLTHIHLDHAGATGAILRSAPHARVFVHPVGVPHLIDPSRLVHSAARLFGDAMDRLWGDCLPVPRANIVSLAQEESLEVGGVTVHVLHTPGHASHHVSYLHADSGIAFAGDAAGARIEDAPIVAPATPPPDIDPDLIVSSLDRILAWKPDRLFLTHFGVVADPAAHAHQLKARLLDWSTRVRDSLADPGTDAELAARFAARIGREMRGAVDIATADAVERGAPPALSWYGLARYWRTLQTTAA